MTRPSVEALLEHSKGVQPNLCMANHLDRLSKEAEPPEGSRWQPTYLGLDRT